MRMTKRIAFAGNMLVDNVKTISALPEKGMLASILSMSRAVGGSVCNTSIDMKVMDSSVSVAALGKVGADDAGEFIVKELESRGIDCSHVIRDSSRPTSFTDVMTLASSGERTFFNMRGADSALRPEDVDLDVVSSCDHFHLGYLLLLDGLDAEDDEYGTKAARLLARVRDMGVTTSIDMVSEQSDRAARIVRPVLRHCDYLIVNEIEGSQITGIPCHCGDGKTSVSAMSRVAEALVDMGVRRKVVLHCPEFSLSRSAAGAVEVVPSFIIGPELIKGTVGAGDAFCAGVLYAALSEWSDEMGLRLGSCSAAANLFASDSVSGALPLESLLAMERRFCRRVV